MMSVPAPQSLATCSAIMPMGPAPWMTDGVAGLDGALFHQRVDRHADRLGQRGVFKGDVVRDVVQDLGAGRHIIGHGAVDQVAVAQAVGAQIVVAAQAVDALSADLGRGLARHPVADGKAGDCRAHF